MSVREVTKLFSPQDAKLLRQTESSAFVGTWFGRSILHTVMAVAFLMHLEISHGIAKFIVAWQRAGEGFLLLFFFFCPASVVGSLLLFLLETTALHCSTAKILEHLKLPERPAAEFTLPLPVLLKAGSHWGSSEHKTHSNAWCQLQPPSAPTSSFSAQGNYKTHKVSFITTSNRHERCLTDLWDNYQ